MVMAAAMDGIPEDSEGSRRDEDRGGAMSGLIPFFFISLRSPLRLLLSLGSPSRRSSEVVDVDT